MRTAEIEKGHGQGDREDEVFHLLGKAGGQPREPLIEMAQAQVEPFGVRCGNGFPIWRSANAARINRDASAWAVPDAFAAWDGVVVTIVLLDLDGVIGPLKSIVQDAPDETAPAVRRNLKLIRHPARNVADELSAGRLVTLADDEGNNKFGLLA
jgi:hypothetical protein